MIQKMKLSSSNLKKYFTFQDGIFQKFLTFSQKNIFLIIREMEHSSPKLKSPLYFFQKIFLVFQEISSKTQKTRISYALGNGTL